MFPSALLLAYPRNEESSDLDIFWSYQQISKSILGWSTAMLIFYGLYEPSYAKRLEIFTKEFKEHEDLCDLVSLATKFKLNPSLKPIKSSDLKNFWKIATRSHLHVCESYISKFYR